jgi:YesN/AraC family two-component response regulator
MPANQGHILLADDEETFLEATQDLLQEEGYDCHVVRNAEELGHALHSAGDFDVLITDLNMPGNRVLDMVREIRSQSAQLPVIVVTGYPSVPTAVESIHLHVLEYLIKPVDYPALLSAIKQGLQQMQVLRSVRQARKEAISRVEQLAKIEETLKAWGTTIPNSDIEGILLPDSKTQDLQVQRESSSHVLGQDSLSSRSSRIPTPEDYFHLREAVFETIQVLQKTKSAFRSKDLAMLRKKLENVLTCTKEFLD